MLWDFALRHIVVWVIEFGYFIAISVFKAVFDKKK